MWTCAKFEKGIQKVNVPSIVFFNIKLESYVGNMIIVNGLQCDTLHDEEDTLFYEYAGKLRVPNDITNEQRMFIQESALFDSLMVL
jgi:hypothetical protein